jgi:ribonuclease D
MMTGITLVTNPSDLGKLVARLGKKTRIAVDTEAASFHRYRDRVFLIQLSSDSENAIVDPLAVEDISGVGALLEDPGIEVVFHDADFDLRSLDRDYKFRVRNVFDTRIAAQLVGEPAIGLGHLLEKYFGIKVDKRFQRADWSKRPLEQGMIDYAAGDTSHLLGLRDELERQLKELGRLDWARDEFKRLEYIRWTVTGDSELAFLRIKGTRALDTRALGVLSELYSWRDGEAKTQHRPPFKIVSNQALLAIAQAGADDQEGLLAAGVPRSTVKRYGAQIIKAAKKGAGQPYTPPRRTRERR